MSTVLLVRILDAAQPYLVGKTVTDAVVGISLVGMALSDGNVGVSYVLRENLPGGCSVFPYGQTVVGKDAQEVAAWSLYGTDNLMRTMGMAVLTAAAGAQTLEDVNAPYGVNMMPMDVLGMVGYIPAVEKTLGNKARALVVFDQGLMQSTETPPFVYPVKDQCKMLPQCDVVTITGTAFVNHTIDSLLSMCTKAREIVLVGASTPMYPQSYTNSDVTALAGSLWDGAQREKLFRAISLGGGIAHVRSYMIKKTLRIGAC